MSGYVGSLRVSLLCPQPEGKPPSLTHLLVEVSSRQERGHGLCSEDSSCRLLSLDLSGSSGWNRKDTQGLLYGASHTPIPLARPLPLAPTTYSSPFSASSSSSTLLVVGGRRQANPGLQDGGL